MADGASAVTAVFSLRNSGRGPVDVAPRVTLPQGWSTVAAMPTVTLGPDSSDTWLVGVFLPASAGAGFYSIRATLSDTVETDSVIVHVIERRAIEVIAADAPAFAAAGDAYSLRFTVRNRGNAADTVTMKATSSARSKIDLDMPSATLAPGEAMTVVARVSSQIGGRGSVEDVVELTATGRTPSEEHASAASNVLIVPRTSRNAALATVPAELTIRGARAGTGVSPLALTGAGPIAPGSATTMDFAFRLPAGAPTVFGERDEYRVDVANERYTVRLGDGSHAFSPLSGSGYQGFGGEVQANGTEWAGGTYIAKDRWTPNGSTEAAVMAQRKFDGDDASLSTVLVGRSGDVGVASVEGRAHVARNTVLDVETSKSDSAGVVGFAHRAQLSGQTGWMTYDAGWLRGAPTFSGIARGNEYKHASFTALPAGPISFGVTAGDYASTSLAATDTGERSRSRSMLFEATTTDGTSLSYERLVQQTDGTSSFDSFEHSVRLRGQERVGRFDIRGGVGHHIVASSTMTKRSFESFDAAVHTDVGKRGGLDVYAERSSGGALPGVEAPGVVLGAATNLRLPFGLAFYANGSTMIGSTLRVTSLSQADITLSKRLGNGMTAALRQHVAIMPYGERPAGMNGIYLELRAPLSIPTAPLRTPGRVSGRIVDAATGRGLPDVLVRVGKEAAISDANGRVALSGLAPGSYGLSVESADRSRGGVILGDQTVEVSANAGAPRRFATALAVGAHVRATVRQSAFSNGVVAAESDSLVDAGSMDNVVVALIGVRDTIYQTTDAEGRIDFGVVTPGTWTAKVIGEDLLAFHSFERESYSLVIRGGEQRDLDFRLVPKRRTITVLVSDEPQVLEAASSSAKPAEVIAAARDTVALPSDRETPRRASVTSHATVRGWTRASQRTMRERVIQLQGTARAAASPPATAAATAPRAPTERGNDDRPSLWWIVAVLVAFGAGFVADERRRRRLLLKG